MKVVTLANYFLGGVQYLFFNFAPLYFIVHLLFNLLGITNPILFILVALILSVVMFPPKAEELRLAPSILSASSLLIGTLLLTIINLKIGIDDSSDTYFYHLNTAIPITLYHDLLNTRLYDLVGYSIGYPKFGEFLQAIFIQLTNHFYGYGLASLLVIPASYTVTYQLARQLGLDQRYSDLVGLTYAFNPVNVAQATTGYVDSIQALYVLTTLLLARQASNLPRLVFFLINLIALINIKLTGLLLGGILFLVWLVWHGKTVLRLNCQVLPCWLLTLAAGGIGLAHYLTNWLKFGTVIYPFIDAKLSQYLHNACCVGQSNQLERIIKLFWFIPEPFAAISLYSPVNGAFSVLWYPLPFFMVLAILKAFYKKDSTFLALQGIFWVFFFLDPGRLGRYVAYFQFAGIVALPYLFKELVQRRWILTMLSFLPLAYLLQGCYIIFNPDLGVVKRRLTQYNQYRVLLDSIESTNRQAFTYYYDVQSVCSGYYWLLKFKQVEVKLTQQQPLDHNYFYIYTNDQGLCTFSIGHDAARPKFKVYSKNGSQYFEANFGPSFASEYCKICVSEYGCTYVPFYVRSYTQNLSDMFRSKRSVEKELTIEYQTIDGNKTTETFKF